MNRRIGTRPRPDGGDMPFWLHETILVLCMFTSTTSITWLWALEHARGTGGGLDGKEIGFLIMHAVAYAASLLVLATLIVRKILRARARSKALASAP